MIQPGTSYKILASADARLVGREFEVESIELIQLQSFVTVKGYLKGNRNKTTITAVLGPLVDPICKCSRLDFPHKRNPKCLVTKT